MKVIFTDSVTGVASKGDIKNVKDGFYRNYLLPYKKAMMATEPLIKEWEERRKKMLIEKEQIKAQFEEIKRRIAGVKVKIEKKITAKGTLYGGVKQSDIAKAIQNQLNLEVTAEFVVIDKPIKSVGVYGIKLNLGEGIETNLEVEVVEKK